MKDDFGKIYTRRGDDGTTGLFGDKRVKKNNLRLICYGEVDELNCWLGYVPSQSDNGEIKDVLSRVQNKLFSLQASLANLDNQGPQLEQKDIDWLEQQCDIFSSRTTKLNNFVLPGGSTIGSMLHISRAVCRRAERNLATLIDQDKINPFNLKYLNRLSDLLFIMARWVNKEEGFEEVEPTY